MALEEEGFKIINNIVLDNETLRYGARGIKRKVKKEILKQFHIN